MVFFQERSGIGRRISAARKYMDTIGLYLHIPFCNGKCPYCDFYSVGDLLLTDQYTDALLNEMQMQANDTLMADTFYLGGGTPPLLGTENLIRLIQAARKQFRFSGEATLEANPNSITEAMLYRLREAGFNRISFGMQSAVSEELLALGRRHTPQQVQEAVKAAQNAGFTNISVDLMLGIPHQTLESALRSVSFALELGVQHISAYLLKIEEGTPFCSRGADAQCPAEDVTCDIYLTVVDVLSRAGFHQYEISNFSLPGLECRHNLKYWHCEEYLGFGPVAHSFWHRRRWGHTRELRQYLAAPEQTVFVTDEQAGGFEEYAMLRLRLTEGLDTRTLKQFGVSAENLLKKAAQFEKAGYVQIRDGVLSLTPRGFLVSNELIAGLIL